MNRLLCLIPLWVLLASPGGLRSDDDLDRILKTVPDWMNTVAVIDVKALNRSPRAIREKWAEKHQDEYLSGAINIPPKASVVVLAGCLDPMTFPHSPVVGVTPVPANHDLKTMAEREGATLEQIGDSWGLLSSRRGYVFRVGTDFLAGTRTMPRQTLARWLRFAKSSDSVSMSPYLRGAVASRGEAQVVLAVDLQEMFDPVSVRLEVAAAGVGSEGGDALVRLLSGARGLTFTATVAETTQGRLRIDFAGEAQPFKKSLQVLLPRVMIELGLEIEEFRSVPPGVEKSSVTFEAGLSDRSLRRVLSVLSGSADLAAPSESVKDAAALTATMRYYRAIDTMLEDLRSTTSKKSTASDWAKSATWFETYANKVEQLSLAEVDPEVQKYSASVASKLRAMAGSLRGTKMQVEQFNSYITVEAYGARSGYGRFSSPSISAQSNLSEIRAKQAELAAKLEPEREKMWGVLEDDRQKVRRAMAAKYKIDFDAFK